MSMTPPALRATSPTLLGRKTKDSPMPKLAANLSWIYQEVPFLQRFGAAAAHGFKAVEILFPYEAPAADIAGELKKHKLTQALFNLPPGDWSKGERGLAALPGREAEFSAALDKDLAYATW